MSQQEVPCSASISLAVWRSIPLSGGRLLRPCRGWWRHFLWRKTWGRWRGHVHRGQKDRLVPISDLSLIKHRSPTPLPSSDGISFRCFIPPGYMACSNERIHYKELSQPSRNAHGSCIGVLLQSIASWHTKRYTEQAKLTGHVAALIRSRGETNGAPLRLITCTARIRGGGRPHCLLLYFWTFVTQEAYRALLYRKTIILAGCVLPYMWSDRCWYPMLTVWEVIEDRCRAFW